MTALAIGFAAESVGRRVVGVPSAGQRTESALLSVFETIRPKSLDDRASRVRVASLETGFSFKQESEQLASTSQHASFGERFLFDLASFDERFAGGDISVAETEDSDSNVLNYAYLPSPGPGEHASQSVTGRSTPKLAPTALSPPASAAGKRVATAESHMDDARYVHLKRLGPTPPNTYKLVMREEPFHGVRAIRLVPVGDGRAALWTCCNQPIQLQRDFFCDHFIQGRAHDLDQFWTSALCNR